MKEADIRREVYRSLREMGYWPITQTDLFVCSRCGARNHPPVGRPDILVLNPSGLSFVVEVKVIPRDRKGWPTSLLRPEQREWLERWVLDGGLAFVAIGELIPRKRRLWFIPFQELLGLIDQADVLGVKSIPTDAKKDRRFGGLVLPQNRLVQKLPGGKWELACFLKEREC